MDFIFPEIKVAVIKTINRVINYQQNYQLINSMIIHIINFL